MIDVSSNSGLSETTKWVLGSIGVILTWVISGVIGFYAAVYSIKSELNVIENKMTKVESSVISLKLDASNINTIDSRLNTLENDFKYVKKETEQAISTNSAIKYLIDVERNKTLNELNEILKKKGK